MLRYGFAVFFVGIMAVAAGHTSTAAADDPVTFSKDVLPILQKNCQSCHRPGQMAPMSLVTFRDARPWARSMKTKVETRQMPPWFADAAHGQFANCELISAASPDSGCLDSSSAGHARSCAPSSPRRSTSTSPSSPPRWTR